MHLQELKAKSPFDLLAYAEFGDRKRQHLAQANMMFAILKQLADNDVAIYGSGVLEYCQTGLDFYGHLNQITCPDQMISMYLHARCGGLDCALAIRLKAKFGRQKMANVILHY